jgi:hypothetical protein
MSEPAGSISWTFTFIYANGMPIHTMPEIVDWTEAMQDHTTVFRAIAPAVGQIPHPVTTRNIRWPDFAASFRSAGTPETASAVQSAADLERPESLLHSPRPDYTIPRKPIGTG